MGNAQSFPDFSGASLLLQLLLVCLSLKNHDTIRTLSCVCAGRQRSTLHLYL